MHSLRDVQTELFGVPKNEQHQVLQDALLAHVESFNFVLKEGLGSMIKTSERWLHRRYWEFIISCRAYFNIETGRHFSRPNLPPLEMGLENGDRLSVQFLSCNIGAPNVKAGAVAKTYKVFPAECRGRGVTYRAYFQVKVSWSLNGTIQELVDKTIGEVPIMVKSQACNLDKLKPKDLIAVGEEENECGGYFIINGLEKVARLLIVPRRNYPVAIQNNGWKKRGDLFTEFGVSARCVRHDQSGSNIVMHYLTDGTVKLMFTYKREMYIVPVIIILKALVDETDGFIYTQLIKGKESDTFYKGCVKNMLRKINEMNIFFQDQALKYLGEIFSVKLGLPSWYTSGEIAKFLIDQSICVHLQKSNEKFNFLVLMFQKLFSLVKNECALESQDNLMNQEILTPGALYLIVVKEKLYSWLFSLRMNIEKKLKSAKTSVISPAIMKDCISKTISITRSVENVYATGNFLPRYENSLQQNSGLVIHADKLNFWRYLSHFRAVHRGAFFAQMRTTTVRKLLPEAWGFLCPVHTPDGTPCGLLNHMASMCQVVNSQPETGHLFNLFCKYGLIPVDDPISTESKFYTVLFDGKVLGRVLDKMAPRFIRTLRSLKSKGLEMVPNNMEICFIPRTKQASQYPGIFIFTSPARMVRPVKNLVSKTTELIGTLEQVYLHVALKPEDIVSGVTSHEEIDTNHILSMLANQIPYSDFNQSPRNMYECQMGKQTMGTPCHSLRYRSDNKLYAIRTPHAPIVRPTMHDYYKMDDYPLGTNAIVAVISYTGYDMEDAIILNKSSVERGFKHGSIYKTEVVNLRVIAGDKGLQKSLYFGREKDDVKYNKFIDIDGLPHIGARVHNGDPICCYIDRTTGHASYVKYKSDDVAYIEDVKVLGNDSGTDVNQQVAIKFRIPRNPLIGDKFASRHGQKGICSFLLPVEDMPFTESGMTPDIIFNPHGFPSRMTIGMMIESMAGKHAAIEGLLHDATPFKYSETETALEYFGECLKKVGYDYYGTERMYSGTNGTELEADIFFGVIYYQRLRHMVSDKFQARNNGPVDPLTRQPVKGRKREGGVRFGEMERDALIAHGASSLLLDRLFSCSDASQQYMCAKCQDLLSAVYSSEEWTCTTCGSSKDITLIDIPYVFRYLCAELAAVGIKVNLELGDLGQF